MDLKSGSVAYLWGLCLLICKMGIKALPGDTVGIKGSSR